MEAGKWKTTREVTRNTCNPEYHSEGFTGSKSLIVGLFLRDQLTKQRHSECHVLLLLQQGLETTSSDSTFPVAIKH